MTESYSFRFESKKSAEEYDSVYADGESTYANILFGIEKKILVRLIESLPSDYHNSNYLDFATGTGRIISFIENYFDNSTGVDISAEMLAICEKRVKRSVLVCTDITKENLGCIFSVMTAFRFFLNAEDSLRLNVIQSLSPLLARDGLLIVNNHGRPFSVNVIGAVGRILGFQKKQKTLRDSAFERFLAENGFYVIDKICYGFFGERIFKLLGFKLATKLEERLVNSFITRAFGTCAIYVLKKGNIAHL